MQDFYRSRKTLKKHFFARISRETFAKCQKWKVFLSPNWLMYCYKCKKKVVKKLSRKNGMTQKKTEQRLMYHYCKKNDNCVTHQLRKNLFTYQVFLERPQKALRLAKNRLKIQMEKMTNEKENVSNTYWYKK